MTYVHVMRDDIHRRLPMSNAWRRVVQQCARDADSERRTPVMAQAIVASAGIRPPFVQRLKEAMEHCRGELFPAMSLAAAVQPTTEAERRLLQNCGQLVTEVSPDEAVRRGIIEGLETSRDAHLREICAHTFLDFPRQAPELYRRLESAAAAIDLDELALRAAGEAPRLTTSRPPLDLDAELRRPQ
jgi:hypothetical protein